MLLNDKIKNEYGDFIAKSPLVYFEINDVPSNLHSLIPYASFWGLSDDLEREQLVDCAPSHLKETLRRIIADNDDALDEWLAGDEARNPRPCSAYVAFSAMRMAADYV